jgi:c-di-GMP-binding flagellar brake protein YcgR
MNNKENLMVGEKIELEISKGSEFGQYLSKVEDIIDDKTFIITRPMGKEQATYLNVGETVRVIYYRKDAMYYFDAEVKERMRDEKTLSAKMSIKTDKYKLQRRNYYRLGIMVPVTVIIPQSDEYNNDEIIKNFDTIDISGGGIRIQSNFRIQVGRIIKLSINAAGMEHEVIDAKVIRCIVSNNDINAFEIAIEFQEVSPSLRQQIVQLIFDRKNL